MALQRPPFLGLLVLATLASVLGAWFSFRRRETQGAVSLAGLMAFAALWIVAYGLQLSTVTLGAKVFWWQVKYIGIVFVPTAWLIFALEYTGLERWVTRRTVTLLFVVPAIQLVVVWTNSLHHWYVQPASLEAGPGYVTLSNPVAPGFWVFVAYNYLLLLLGTVVMLRLVRSGDPRYRRQSVPILLGVAMPWLANGLFLLRVRPLGLDLTPLGFIVTGLSLSFAVHRQALLDIVPIPRELARAELLDSISDATFVVDEHRTVVDVNPAGERLVADDVADPVGQPVDRVLPELADLFESDLATGVDRQEVTLTRRQGTQFVDVRVSPLRRGYGAIRGYVVIVRDVTDRTRHRQRLEVMNRVLRHDIRNDVNLILAHADALQSGDGDHEHRLERITELAYDVVSLSDRARAFERTLGGEVTLERVDLVPVVEAAVESLGREYPDAVVEVERPDAAAVYADPLIESAVKNLLENAVEHHDRSAPTVAVSLDAGSAAGWVELEVADDGPGIPDEERAVIEQGHETQVQHSSGLGLWLINWIVTESGGEVRFDENEPRGTRVTVRLRAADGPRPGTGEP